MEIGEMLRRIRNDNGFSLREASKRSGVSHSYIDSIEKGFHPKTKSPIKPSPDTLRRLSDAYHYPYEELMKIAGYLDEEGNVSITKDQAKNVVMDMYARLPQDRKQIVDDMIKALAKKD